MPGGSPGRTDPVETPPQAVTDVQPLPKQGGQNNAGDQGRGDGPKKFRPVPELRRNEGKPVSAQNQQGVGQDKDGDQHPASPVKGHQPPQGDSLFQNGQSCDEHHLTPHEQHGQPPGHLSGLKQPLFHTELVVKGLGFKHQRGRGRRQHKHSPQNTGDPGDKAPKVPARLCLFLCSAGLHQGIRSIRAFISSRRTRASNQPAAAGSIPP